MKIIAHRRNTIAELEATPTTYGVEVDVRSRGSRLIIAHDPFVDGPDAEDWFAHYRHATLIWNTKEEGLEEPIGALMRNHDFNDFFFLDQSFPFIIKTSRSGERRCAVRVSEYESVETALALAGMIDWVWVDVFTRLALSGSDARRLKAAGFKLCLVSPELQGRWDQSEIASIRNHCARDAFTFDAVCTKTPALWSAAA